MEATERQAIAAAQLDEAWQRISALADVEAARDPVWGETIEAILQNGGAAYPFALITQVLGKLADQDVHCLAIQDSSSLIGAWDARSLAHKVVHPWVVSIGRPLHGGPEPYTNNALRKRQFDDEMRRYAKNKVVFDQMVSVLTWAQNGTQLERSSIFDAILIELRRVAERNRLEYRGPVSLKHPQFVEAIRSFLAESSGGIRLQAVMYAVAQALSVNVPSIDEVKSYPVNASDAVAGRAGDVELASGGKPLLAIEVKDRALITAELQSSISKARDTGTPHILFAVKKGAENPSDEVVKLVNAEYARGIDITLISVEDLVRVTGASVSANTRGTILRQIHDALGDIGAPFSHRKRWLELTSDL